MHFADDFVKKKHWKRVLWTIQCSSYALFELQVLGVVETHMFLFCWLGAGSRSSTKITHTTSTSPFIFSLEVAPILRPIMCKMESPVHGFRFRLSRLKVRVVPNVKEANKIRISHANQIGPANLYMKSLKVPR